MWNMTILSAKTLQKNYKGDLNHLHCCASVINHHYHLKVQIKTYKI